jgi:hypothetical protein
VPTVFLEFLESRLVSKSKLGEVSRLSVRWLSILPSPKHPREKLYSCQSQPVYMRVGLIDTIFLLLEKQPPPWRNELNWKKEEGILIR